MKYHYFVSYSAVYRVGNGEIRTGFGNTSFVISKPVDSAEDIQRMESIVKEDFLKMETAIDIKLISVVVLFYSFLRRENDQQDYAGNQGLVGFQEGN